MRPLDRLRRTGGVARFADLGLTRRQVAALVGSGDLRHVCHGWFALPQVGADVVAALEQGGVLTCVSALRHYGVPVPGDAAVVHCAVPSHRSRRRPARGVRLHRDLGGARRGRPIVGLVEALARAASCLDYPDAVATLDLGCRDRPPSFVADVLALIRSRDLYLADALRIDVDLGSRSRQESLVRLALRAAGVHVLAGAVLPGVGEVDLLVEGALVLEIDGFAYHSGRREYRTDRRRDRRLVELALTVNRYAYEDVDPSSMVERAREVCAALALGPRAAVASVAERDLVLRDAVIALGRRPEAARSSARLRRALRRRPEAPRVRERGAA